MSCDLYSDCNVSISTFSENLNTFPSMWMKLSFCFEFPENHNAINLLKVCVVLEFIVEIFFFGTDFAIYKAGDIRN